MDFPKSVAHAVNLADGLALVEQAFDRYRSDGIQENEAEIRFQLIDQLLLGLGWPKGQTHVEQYLDGGRTDYELGHPPRIIVEAKAGPGFVFPAGHRRRALTDIPSLMKADPALDKAIQQLQSYCASRGVEIGVVANGFQIVAFAGVRTDGVPPLRGHAIVLDGAEEIVSRFAQLWQFLSPDGVIDDRLVEYLKLAGKPVSRSKPAQRIAGYPRSRPRTPLQRDLALLAELLLLDIPGREGFSRLFMEHCYVSDTKLQSYTRLGLSAIRQDHAGFTDEMGNRAETQQVRSTTLAGLLKSTRSESLLRRPIVLLGDVGVGKTAFLKSLMMRAGDERKTYPIMLYIDFNLAASLTSVSSFIAAETLRQLKSLYGVDASSDSMVRELYREELDSFAGGIFGVLAATAPDTYEQRRLEHVATLLEDREEHLRRLLSHLGSERELAVVIDNADLRSPAIQMEAMAAARRFAELPNVSAFVSMRPKTFADLFAAMGEGRSFTVFEIAAPSVDAIMGKRLEFAISLARGKIPSGLPEVNLDLQTFANLARSISNALLLFPSVSDSGAFLGSLSNGNVNWALDTVVEYFGSSNGRQSQQARQVAASWRHMLPSYELHASSLFQSNIFYSERSRAVNLFDVSGSSSRHHFLLPMLLSYLLETTEGRDLDRFVSLPHLFEELRQYGFTPRVVEQALEKALGAGLVESSIIGSLSLRDGHEPAFRATAAAEYYLRRWLASPDYLSAVWVDTPIFDPQFEAALGEIAAEIDSKDARLRAAEAFRDYLSSMWSDFSTYPTYFNWPSLVWIADRDFQRVRQSLGLL